jgi:hypothetical protein
MALCGFEIFFQTQYPEPEYIHTAILRRFSSAALQRDFETILEGY